MHGIVLLDKPLGLSSNAALQRVRHQFGRIKAGHAGTLDPLATGMLPIFLGEATKYIQHVLTARKAYRATIRFGAETATADAEGEVVATAPIPALPVDAVERVLAQFVGRIRQRPPAYSAIKRDGVPLYRLARQGEAVEAPERDVVIDRIRLLGVGADHIEIDVVCGSGTYIRSLAVDIGRALESAAHLSALRRLWVSPFESRDMTDLAALADPVARAALVLPVDEAMPQFPALALDDDVASALRFGRRPAVTVAAEGRHRLYAPDGSFFGLGIIESGVLRADRLMATG